MFPFQTRLPLYQANFRMIRAGLPPTIESSGTSLVTTAPAATIQRYPIDYRERATGAEHGEPITIGDDCWIGAYNCTFGPISIFFPK